MRAPGVLRRRRRTSFSTRFAVILAVLGALIAGVTAAIPLQLSASEARSIALDRAADKAGTALSLIHSQRDALREFIGGVAQQLSVSLAGGDAATASLALTRQSTVSGSDDVLGASYGTVVRDGVVVPPGEVLRAALLQAAQAGQSITEASDGTPWMVERASVPDASPPVVVFVGRPMHTAFVQRLAADLGSGADSASLAVVRDGTFMSGGTAAAATVTRNTLLPDVLTPVVRSPGTAMLLQLDGSDIAASAVDLGGGISLLVTTSVGSTAVQSSAVVPVAIIAVAMILIALLVVYVIVQRDLQRPLRRLDRAVAALEREEFDVPIPSGNDDELGRLGRSFERMREALRATLAGAQARVAIASELNASQPLYNALERICDRMRGTTGSAAAMIAVAESDMGDAHVIASGVSPAIEPARVFEGGGPLAAAFAPDAPMPLVADALPDSAEATAGLRELCAARLRVGDHVLGVLAVADKPGGFNQADHALVVAAAEQVALALERYRILAVAQRQAVTDELTGLYNYRFLVDYLEQQVALAERIESPLAVLMLDLDRFKQLNDTHGHHAGDDALRAFAQTLHSSIRRSDLAARYGGEEFVVVMANTNRDEARLVAEKIRHAVSELGVRAGDEEVRFTVSIGGVGYPDDTGDARQLLQLADEALYHAKRTGRDRVCFASDPGVERTLTGAGTPWTAQHEDADEHEHDTGHRPSQ